MWGQSTVKRPAHTRIRRQGSREHRALRAHRHWELNSDPLNRIIRSALVQSSRACRVQSLPR